MDSELDSLISKKDWRALDVARQQGPSVASSLQTFLHDHDPVVRLLAVNCLNAVGGPAVPKLLLQALRDSNEQVRINAINGLHEHLPVGDERTLLSIWDADHSPDGFVRQQIPMILGRMQAKDEIPELHRRLTSEPRQDIKDGLISGLAKMGDNPARAEFGKLLDAARGKRTAELIEYVKYLDNPWVIPYLAPVLARKDLAIDLSTHRKSLQRRECDLAVDQVLRISKAQFSFQMNELAQYSDGQIAEAKRYAEGQGR
jgi:HEAT repeat protein